MTKNSFRSCYNFISIEVIKYKMIQLEDSYFILVFGLSGDKILYCVYFRIARNPL